jgi:hypothetical protein
MSFNDFSTIKTRVKSYLDNRTDIDTEIAEWINDARRSLAAEYDFSYLYIEATCETSAGSARYALPADYLGHLSLFLGTKKLMRIQPNEFDNVHGDDATIVSTDGSTSYFYTLDSLEQGEPDYYIDRGMEFDVYPRPDNTYTLTIHYYANPADWTEATDYDYMSTFHTEAVVFGAVLRGAIFLDDDIKVKKFAPLADREVQKMLKKEKVKTSVDSSKRMKSWLDMSSAQFRKFLKVGS